MHYLSYRSFIALHHDPAYLRSNWDDGQWSGCLGKMNESEEIRISSHLAATDLSARYECLIHTESIASDLRACLLKYMTFKKRADQIGVAGAH
jgi:hypothetical protein